ncbi:MAG: nucleotidyltransferase domain-containing protein [Acidobacteriota bacterium]
MALTTTSPHSMSGVATPVIREDVLRDPRYPVHRIADRLLPYLRVLVDQFQPKEIILFGSYAYGQPDEHSDVDLLIIKELEQSPLREAVAIRQAWWPVRRLFPSMPFDLIVIDEAGHRERLAHSAGFYDQIVRQGLRLI